MELEATLEWLDLVRDLAEPYSIEPAIILAMIYVESRGKPLAVNHRSMASGLMQVMPQEAGDVFSDRPTSAELLDPETNITWGLKILNGYMKASGATTWWALYRYSGGKTWPSQEDFTRAYWIPFTRAWAEVEQELRARE